MRPEWKQVPLGDLAEVVFSNVDKHILQAETRVRLCNYLDVYRNRRLTADMSYAEGSATEAEIRRFQLRRGDVVITKDSETPDDIGVPALVTEELHDTICGYHLAILRPRPPLDARFLMHFLQSDRAKSHFLKTATGVTRFGLGLRAIRRLPVILPPPAEQAAIARTLDAADTAIDRTRTAIKRARRLKRALMQALLPPWIGFKRLSVAGLGVGIEQVVMASKVARVCNGSTPSRSRADYWRAGTIPWLATGKVNERVIEKADEFVTERALKECSIQLLPEGTVLVGMIGQGKTRGMVAYLACQACINQNFGAFVPGQHVQGRWLFHYLDFHYSQLREVGGGTNQGALNCFLLKRLRLPLPRLDRQREVVATLDGTDTLIRALQKAQAAAEQIKRGLLQGLLTTREQLAVDVNTAKPNQMEEFAAAGSAS